MNKEKKKSNAAPLAIIAIVLVVAVIGVAWLYNSSKQASNTNQAAANTRRANTIVPANAPSGAPLSVNVIGPSTAAVTIEEFADFQCPACASAHPVMKDLQKMYAGNRNVRFIFRNFPLPIHNKAWEAAVAVEAAGMQGSQKFWAMMDLMFTNQQQWANSDNYREIWKQYAEKIGLDMQKFIDDMSGSVARLRVDEDVKRGRAIGVPSTPSVYLNGRLVPPTDVNVPTLKRLIDAEIETALKSAANTDGGNSQPGTNTTGNNAK